MRRTGLCFQDRFWCVFEFLVLPEKCPSGQKNWKRHLLHDRWNVEHAYFRPIARQQERRVEEARRFRPLRFIESKRAVRKYSRLFGGVAHPVQRSSVVPAFHQRCPTPRFKMIVSPGSA